MPAEGWPEPGAARDQFILARRGARPLHDPWHHQGITVEDEVTEEGTVVRSATVFLTGRECPWRCLMCDLWRFTTPTDTPAGAISGQVRAARAALLAQFGPVGQIKLYNAANFFDPKAVPETDYDAITAALEGVSRVVVECHPALVNGSVDRFLEALARTGREGRPPVRLEVAMGLETAHPQALERLNKRMTLDMFASASRRLRDRGVAVRAFLLISPPFVAPLSQRAWLRRSLTAAFDCGAAVASLVPTRGGNGALESIADMGHFRQPDLSTIETSVDDALQFAGAGRRVLVDLWDLDRFAACRHCFEARRARLHAINIGQRALPAFSCGRCGGTAG